MEAVAHGVTVSSGCSGHVEAAARRGRLDIGHATPAMRSGGAACRRRTIPSRPTSSIDRVWADDPPHRAPQRPRGAYLVAVVGLLNGDRRAGSPREPGCYVLRTDHVSVDIHRFRTSASQARAAATRRRGRPSSTSALDAVARRAVPHRLTRAWVNDARTALEAERRFGQTGPKRRCSCTAGRHAGRYSVSLVTAAARRHPLDERLAGQLMLAQYRSGRQA